jgi:hypothetical protein
VPSLLRNPFVLGGLAMLLAVAAAIVVAVFLGESEGESVIVVPTQVPIATGRTPTQTVVPLEGMSGQALSTLTVRAGPGNGYISLGIARRGSELDVVGKNEDESWLEISYPPRSHLRGWVAADGVELEGSVANLPVGTPEALVLPSVPTYPPGAFVGEEPELTPTPEIPPGPDLVLSDAYLAQGVLVVTVTNQGTADAGAPIDVAIYDGDGSTLLRLARIGEPLPAGASVDLVTQYDATGGPQRLVIKVDPANRVQEMNEDNNAVLFGVSGAPASPSPTAPPGSPTVTPRSSPQVSTPTSRTPTRVPTETPVKPSPTSVPTAQATPTTGG